MIDFIGKIFFNRQNIFTNKPGIDVFFLDLIDHNFRLIQGKYLDSVICKEKGIPPISAAQFKDRIPIRHHFESIDSERGGFLHPQFFRIIFIPITFIHGKNLGTLLFVNYCYHIKGCFKIGDTKRNMSGLIITALLTQHNNKY